MTLQIKFRERKNVFLVVTPDFFFHFSYLSARNQPHRITKIEFITASTHEPEGAIKLWLRLVFDIDFFFLVFESVFYLIPWVAKGRVGDLIWLVHRWQVIQPEVNFKRKVEPHFFLFRPQWIARFRAVSSSLFWIELNFTACWEAIDMKKQTKNRFSII